MNHRIEMHYPAPADTVLRMMTGASFYADRLRRLGVVEFEVLDQRNDGSDFSIRIKRRVSVEAQVPAMLQKLLPAQLTVVHTDRWHIPDRSGEVEFEFRGLPVTVRCRTALNDTPGGCTLVYNWDIRAKAALIGGMVEKLLVEDLELKLAAETRAGVEMLAEAHPGLGS